MTKPQMDNRIALTSRLRYRAVGEDGVLVHLDSGRVIVVNDVGLHIIEQLTQPMTERALIDAIIAEFSVTAADAERDLACFLEELRAEQLLAPPTQAAVS